LTGQCLIQKVHGDLMKGEEVFFVKVKEPSQVRKELLESLKDIVENLHRFEKFKAIREEKLEYLNKLRIDVKELIKLNAKLKSSMPETKLRIALQKSKEVSMKKHRYKKKALKKVVKEEDVFNEPKAPKMEKPKSELDKLQSELSAIESRLGSLK